MSLADELLDSVPENMRTTLSPEPFIVVNDDRTITVPAELRRLGVQYDHNIETVTFKCPRYWDEHDLSQMVLYVNYKRADGHIEPYPVAAIRVDEADENFMYFDWTISRNVTQERGNITFLICAKTTDEQGNEELHWNSELCTVCYISEGMEAEELPEEIKSDLITQLLNIIDSTSAKVEETEDGAVITMTDRSGTTRAVVKHGADGEDGGFYMPDVTQLDDSTLKFAFSANGGKLIHVKPILITLPRGPEGEPGKDGYSPTVTVEEIAEGIRIDVTDKNGTTSYLVKTNGSNCDCQPEVYIGGEDMPEGYVLQIDPDGEPDLESLGIYLGSGEMPEWAVLQIDPDGEVPDEPEVPEVDTSNLLTREEFDQTIGDINAILATLSDGGVS